LDLIRKLDWKRFEELCAAYFVAKSLKAEVTDLGADGGIDVLVYSPDNQDKVLGVVQCKAWSRKIVGIREIRELFGVMNDIGCDRGWYITTSGYSTEARSFVENKHINLMDDKELLQLIRELPAESQKDLLAQATRGDYWTPSCPNCGIKLVSRTARKGGRAGQHFWGCRNFPKCRYKMRARST
jgi:restriction system protein